MRWRARRGFAGVSMAGLLVVLVVALGYGQSTTPSSRELKRLVRMSPVPPDPGEGATTAAGQARVGDAPTEEAETGTNVQVSKRQRPGDSLRVGASETTLASTPDGQKLVAGWNDGEGFAFAPFGPPPALGLSGFGVSTNGGASWTDAGAPPPGSVVALGPGRRGQSATGRYVTRGDPWLAAAGTGKGETTFYFSNLAVWEDQDPAGPPAGVSVHRGRFSGKGFAWTDAVLLQSPNYPDDFLDKEAMTADASAVYVTVTNFIELCRQPFFGFGQIELYRSLDGGTTWSRRIVQPDEAFVTDPKDPTCGQDGIVNQGSAPAVGPSGELYIVWERGWFAPLLGGGPTGLPRATIAFRRSLDQGQSFGPRRTLVSLCSGALHPPAGYNRTVTNDFPRIDVIRTGKHAGRILVTYQDCRAAAGTAPFGQDTDVYVIVSDDQGEHWSAPIPLHRPADRRIQFWPAVAVDGRGVATVVYYQSREVNVTKDPNDLECSVRVGGPLDNPILRQSRVSSLVDVFLVRSLDGGQTWSSPVRVTTRTTNWCRATPLNSIIPNFGDYIDVRTAKDRALITWADGRNNGAVNLIPTVFFAQH